MGINGKNKVFRISARVRQEVKERLKKMSEAEDRSETWILEDAILRRRCYKRSALRSTEGVIN